jgi:hypothetical protein
VREYRQLKPAAKAAKAVLREALENDQVRQLADNWFHASTARGGGSRPATHWQNTDATIAPAR